MSLVPLLALHEVLHEAAQFVAGFENDPHQDTDVGALLIKLRGQVDAVRVTIDITRAYDATKIATASMAGTREALGLRGAA